MKSFFITFFVSLVLSFAAISLKPPASQAQSPIGFFLNPSGSALESGAQSVELQINTGTYNATAYAIAIDVTNAIPSDLAFTAIAPPGMVIQNQSVVDVAGHKQIQLEVIGSGESGTINTNGSNQAIGHITFTSPNSGSMTLEVDASSSIMAGVDGNVLTDFFVETYTFSTTEPTPSPTPAAAYLTSFVPQSIPANTWDTAEELLTLLENNNLSPLYIYNELGYINNTTATKLYHFINNSTNDFSIKAGEGYVIGFSQTPSTDIYTLLTSTNPITNISLTFNLGPNDSHNPYLIGLPANLLSSLPQATVAALCQSLNSQGITVDQVSYMMNHAGENWMTNVPCSASTSQLDSQSAYEILVESPGTWTITNTPPATVPVDVDFEVRLQGITSDTGAQNFTFKFQDPDNHNQVAIATVSAVPDNAGLFTAPVTDVPVNPNGGSTYRVCVKAKSHLQKCFADIAIDMTAPQTIDLVGTKNQDLLVGDTNNDNKISLTDWSKIYAKFITYLNPIAKPDPLDVNNDGFITLTDMALVAINFTQFNLSGDN